jgi:hypothetical protein
MLNSSLSIGSRRAPVIDTASYLIVKGQKLYSGLNVSKAVSKLVY